jgi:hypothetical protein
MSVDLKGAENFKLRVPDFKNYTSPDLRRGRRPQNVGGRSKNKNDNEEGIKEVLKRRD